MLNYLNDLNSVQQEAVKYINGPLLVLAGAGSGKTRIITYRIAHLIATGIPPERLIALTFTNKAAGEIRSRVDQMIEGDARLLWLSTFHSTGCRLLRKYYKRSNFVIYDSEDQHLLVKGCLKELNFNLPYKRVAYSISQLKEHLIDPVEYRPNNFHEELIGKVYTLYQQKLVNNNALDFDDLLKETIGMFKEFPEILNLYQERFLHIMVDEYQDTNYAQYLFLKMLVNKHKNICVVGDEDQSIYSWRGADINNILDFENDYPNAKVIALEENYRSTKHILSLASTLIKHNRARKGKNLWTSNGIGEKPKIFHAENEHEEAEFVVTTIAQLREKEKTLRNIGVFYRVNAQSRVLEDTFLQANIPYVILSGISFYARKEVKDVLSYLKVIFNPDDDVNLKRIINLPTRGISKATLEKLIYYARTNNLSLYQLCMNLPEGMVSGRAIISISGFVKLINNFIDQSKNMFVSKLIEQIVEKTGYLKIFEEDSSRESTGRVENIKELIVLANEFDTHAEEKELGAFLTSITLVSDIDEWDDEDNRVALMTLHSTKGLEFDYVFITGLEEGILPHNNAYEQQALEEERRLCYVGITRARKQLFLSWAKSRKLYRMNYNMPSRFLNELVFFE